MPRPRKKLTAEQMAEVETLASVLSVEQMADYFGIGRSTFFELMKRDGKVAGLYKKGRAKAIGVVAKGLLMKARSGDTASAIFFLKTQAGWKERTELDHTSSDGSMSPVKVMSTEEKLARIAELTKKINDE